MRLAPLLPVNVHDVLFVDEDPAVSVLKLADYEIIRVPIYIQQILETVWGAILKDQASRMFERAPTCPWLQWVRESQSNYQELWSYGMDIMDEHFHRFGSRNMHPYRHGSAIGFERLGVIPTALPDVPGTIKPISIDDARAYYIERNDLTYTNRETVVW